MGKRKLITGVILGAVIGGLVALTNREARVYTKGKLTCATERTKYYMKNPSEAVRNIRETVDQVNDKLVYHSANTVQTLAQVEETLDKMVKKDS